MLIKEAQYETCKSCSVEKLISEEVHGCENCQKEFSQSYHRLELNVWYEREIANKQAERFNLCSWKCVLEYLPKINTTASVHLPMLNYCGGDIEGLGVKDFLKLINTKDNAD